MIHFEIYKLIRDFKTGACKYETNMKIPKNFFFSWDTDTLFKCSRLVIYVFYVQIQDIWNPLGIIRNLIIDIPITFETYLAIFKSY